MVAQFFYSHVGFPDRNQHVDSAVTGLLESATVDQGAAPIWYTDIVRATQLHLCQDWMQKVNDHTRNAPLAQMAPRGRNHFG